MEGKGEGPLLCKTMKEQVRQFSHFLQDNANGAFYAKLWREMQKGRQTYRDTFYIFRGRIS
jgi:hypothetical protein